MNLAPYASTNIAGPVAVLPAALEPTSIDETNHRVANSLQFLAALVAIEARRISDPAAIEVFERTMQRIGAIARVHRQLYQSRTADDVDLGVYISELCNDLEQLGGDVIGGHRIEVDAEPVILSSQDAASVGIIISELVTNARKHAFGPGEKGEMRIALRELPAGGYALEVSDRGRGFGASGKPEGTGLGSELISILARRLHAQHAWHDNGPGTSFTLRVGAG